MRAFGRTGGGGLLASRLPDGREKAGHSLPPVCSGGDVSKDVQDLQMPSGESPSIKRLAGIKGVGERRGLYQVSGPAY